VKVIKSAILGFSATAILFSVEEEL